MTNIAQRPSVTKSRSRVTRNEQNLLDLFAGIETTLYPVRSDNAALGVKQGDTLIVDHGNTKPVDGEFYIDNNHCEIHRCGESDDILDAEFIGDDSTEVTQDATDVRGVIVFVIRRC